MKSFLKKADKKIKSFFRNGISEIIFCAFSSLFLIVVYNFTTLQSIIFAGDGSSLFIKLFEISLICSFVFLLCFFVFLLLSFGLKTLKFFLILLLFFSTISLYIRNKFGIIFDEIMMVNALDSIGHINDAIDFSLLIYFLILFFLPAFLIIKLKLKKTGNKKKFSVIIGVFFLTIFLAVFLKKQRQEFAFNSLSPINYIGSFERYSTRFYHNKKIAKSRIGLDKIFDFEFPNNPKNFNIILVIGESLRSDHLSLNGYQRKTTPNLENIKNLINYQVEASFNTTSPAVTSLLSHRLKSEFVSIPPEKSIVHLMKNLGFNTYWYSVQSSKEFGNGMLNIMAMEADEYFFRDYVKTTIPSNSKLYDDALLPFLKKAISKKGNNFVVLHTFGSHIRYHDRYPESFRKFFPECTKSPSSCDKESLVNSYDNSVLYTDYFLDKALSTIKETNSIVFFISDHGSFLGENNQFANGNSVENSANAHIVPMLIYATPQWLSQDLFYKKFSFARKNSTKKLNQDYFFDTVLDCVGIKSKLIETRKYSVCKEID